MGVGGAAIQDHDRSPLSAVSADVCSLRAGSSVCLGEIKKRKSGRQEGQRLQAAADTIMSRLAAPGVETNHFGTFAPIFCPFAYPQKADHTLFTNRWLG